MAPVALSTSYFTGSAFIGISIITLNSSGHFGPGVTLSKDMGGLFNDGNQKLSGLTLILLTQPLRPPELSFFNGTVRPLANLLPGIC
jgi:hypothetical protein